LGSFVLDDTLAILVVEDDQSIQSLVEEALTDGGFEPHIAASAEEAVTLLQDANSRYRALVTDISLAGAMDGWQVAKHAREIDQAFPVIYMVGAHADQWAINGVPNSLLLVKPSHRRSLSVRFLSFSMLPFRSRYQIAERELEVALLPAQLANVSGPHVECRRIDWP
jgi:CheY-like chemotaxis protein